MSKKCPVFMVAEASENRGGGRHDMLASDDVGAMKTLWQKGWRIKQIVRDLGHGKNTVRRYVRAFEKGLDVPPSIAAPPGRPRGLGSVSPDWLKERLVRHGGNADVVRQELVAELGVVTSLRTVERAVADYRQEIRALSAHTKHMFHRGQILSSTSAWLVGRHRLSGVAKPTSAFSAATARTGQGRL